MREKQFSQLAMGIYWLPRGQYISQLVFELIAQRA